MGRNDIRKKSRDADGRFALVLAAELFGSVEAGREYLRTPNFALGGAMPLNLSRTGRGRAAGNCGAPSAGRWRARVKAYRAREISGPVAPSFHPLYSRT